ncbi:hypothetical protein [Lentzea sp. CC55]|uniref:hypothetical protein n=1 Tax=Lentzea sp. CC55 TaxID=2884909 RepID=UPI001F30F69C|nr:hypothetical protein [Lentzea sp. CC55]MCG8924995.1 hypothetical protein [Lentzea sp. CC55]
MSEFVWWVSPHDGESHAILRSQAEAGANDGAVDTECDKVLLIERAQHCSNGRFCQKCLVKMGQRVIDCSWFV